MACLHASLERVFDVILLSERNFGYVMKKGKHTVCWSVEGSTTFGVFPFRECVVGLKGCVWECDGLKMDVGKRVSCSNAFKGEDVVVECNETVFFTGEVDWGKWLLETECASINHDAS